MPKANPRQMNIDKAPFFLGAQVTVVKLADEQADDSFLGRSGIVRYYEYDCGCGQQYPCDPMIGVGFDSAIEEFWAEELSLTDNTYDE